MSQWDALIQSAAQKYNVDPKLIASIVQTESSGNPKAYNAEYGASGLGQQIPATAKALGIDPKDPAQSIEGVAKLLDENLSRYGNPEQAILAYHGGTNQAAWGPKTQDYLRKVSSNYGAPQVAKPAENDFAAQDFSAPVAGASTAADNFAAQDFAAPAVQAQAPQVAQQVPAPGAAAAAPQPQSQGLGSMAMDGLAKLGEIGVNNVNAAGRGISDALDAPAEWLASGAEKSGLTGLLSKAGVNMPTYDQQVALNAQSRADYAARNGGGIQQTAGRTLGNILGVGGPIAAGEAALVKGGTSLAKAAGNPAALEAVGGFLRGQGGLASRSVYGAGQGAAAGALLSGGQPDTTLAESAGLGAVLGGAVPIAASAIKGGINAGRALIDPFTEAGQTRIAQNTLERLAGKGNTTPDLTAYVPGSTPTLAQATNNTRIAGMERAAMNKDPEALTALRDTNNAARMAHLESISGTPTTLADAIAAREAAALPMMQASLQNARPANTNPVIKQIDDILGSPAGQRDAVVNALGKVRSKLDLGANGAQSDVAQLYGVRKSINDQLETVAGRDNSASQQASRELIQVRDSLDKAMEKAAPGFAAYRQTYADMSKPINAQTFLQNAKLTDQTGQAPTLAKVNNLLDQIKKQRAAPGANDAKAISDQQLEGLKALQMDLRRQANSNKGMPPNSATVQNLAMANMMQSFLPGALGRIPLGPEAVGGGLGYALAGPVGSGVGAAAGNALRQSMAAQNSQIEARLIDLLTDPTTKLARSQSGATNGLLQRLMAPASVSGASQNSNKN
ncbi:transglycosylase SLT domain-containing protein [Pseudomonas sp. MONT-RG-20F-20-E-7-02]|uniref:transglycosylase SLT domain-containing protein n=1 Tax=Pseudomonas sp. MONT-RG-20F-20-E-7-02 TaxID=2914979 RepID=UPI001F5685DA|nr:transglycosylase SLT domain-containing protein [Pseudomonas sp. MONT-RG-20F-20-E-7-02]